MKTPSFTAADRERIIVAIRALNTECARAGLMLEICVWEGIEMLLAYPATTGSRDLGSVFRPASELAEVARAVGVQTGLPPDWLEQGVTQFLQNEEGATGTASAEWESLSAIRIVRPTPEYLLAMKCLAARAQATPRDHADAAFLAHRLGLPTVDAVLEVVGRYASRDRLHVRTREFAERIVQSAHGGPSPVS